MSRRHQNDGGQRDRSGDRYYDTRGRELDGRMRADGSRYTVDLFALTFAIGSLASGASTAVQQVIDASYEFEWTHSVYLGELHGGTAPFLEGQITEVNIQIQDTGTGKSLFYAPVPISSIAGTAREPFKLPLPRLFPRAATVTVTATNFSVAGQGAGAQQYDNITLTMLGRRLWERSN
ncbi:MAG: hypothetical protein ACREHV_11775 [Rhizomicrobium sp.]